MCPSPSTGETQVATLAEQKANEVRAKTEVNLRKLREELQKAHNNNSRNSEAEIGTLTTRIRTLERELNPDRRLARDSDVRLLMLTSLLPWLWIVTI